MKQLQTQERNISVRHNKSANVNNQYNGTHFIYLVNNHLIEVEKKREKIKKERKEKNINTYNNIDEFHVANPVLFGEGWHSVKSDTF